MDTSLIISATNAGKKLSKAISNINPEKDNTILKTFAQIVNALTTNTYVDATRINKMSVEEESGAAAKTEGVITFDSSTNVVTYNGDATLSYFNKANGTTATVESGGIVAATSNYVFYAPATTNYTAAVLLVS